MIVSKRSRDAQFSTGMVKFVYKICFFKYTIFSGLSAALVPGQSAGPGKRPALIETG
jgi:hypothetical protein